MTTAPPVERREICPYAMVYMVWWPEHDLVKFGRCWRMSRIYGYLRTGARLIYVSKPMRKAAEEQVLSLARRRFPRPYGRREEAEWLLPGERGRRGGSGYSEIFLVRPEQLNEAIDECYIEGTYRYADDELDAILWRRAHQPSADPSSGYDEAPGARDPLARGLAGPLDPGAAQDPVDAVAAQIEACATTDSGAARGDDPAPRRGRMADGPPAPGRAGRDDRADHRLPAAASDVDLLDALTDPPRSQRDVQRRMGWGGTRALTALRAWRARHDAHSTAPGASQEHPEPAESCGRTARQQIDSRGRERGGGARRARRPVCSLSSLDRPRIGSSSRGADRPAALGSAADATLVLLQGPSARTAARRAVPRLRHGTRASQETCAASSGEARGRAAPVGVAPAHAAGHRRGAASARRRGGGGPAPPGPADAPRTRQLHRP